MSSRYGLEDYGLVGYQINHNIKCVRIYHHCHFHHHYRHHRGHRHRHVFYRHHQDYGDNHDDDDYHSLLNRSVS